MMGKICSSVQEALADVHDGASIMVGGFALSGTPYNLVKGLVENGVKDLTFICTSYNNILALPDGSQVKKFIAAFAVSPFHIWRPNPLEEGIKSGKIVVELVPLGTLIERIRAGGAGLAGFYTPTGVGTPIEAGKEKRVFDGKEYILEGGLRADFAFVKAYKADTLGNLIYRKASRNSNPIMAMAADITIAEVGEIVEPGAIDPDIVVTPGIFVDRLVKVPPLVITFKERTVTYG
jgi:3-oxoacid CoA-transferase A subunit